MVPIWYSSLTEVKRAADIPASPLYDLKVSDVMSEATEAVESLCSRVFYPTLATRYFPWPQDPTQSPSLLRLGDSEAISLVSLVNGDGSTVDTSRLKLIKEGKVDDGPPYNALIINGSFVTNGTFPERSIAATCNFGFRNDERSVAFTTTNLSGSTVDISNAANIGVGSLIRIGDERLVVTYRGWKDSGNVTPVTLDDEESADRFTLSVGSTLNVGEELFIGNERMLITEIIGNDVIVDRGAYGSALSVHTAVTTVYVNRRLTVERAVLGSTATDTLSGAGVQLFLFPPLVHQLHRAEALNIIQQDAASYGSRSGSNQGEMPLSIKGLQDLREKVRSKYARFRSGAA